MTTEVYFSCDIEADGPIPGENSMLSLGCAAFRLDASAPNGGAMLGTYSADLDLLPGATQDEDTMAWWHQTTERRSLYEKSRENAGDIVFALNEFVNFIDTRLVVGTPPGEPKAKPVFVGWPATYDFMFVYWYLMRFTGASPFKHAGFCLKTAAAVKLGKPFRNMGKQHLPKAWLGPERHTHVALDDAIEQGWIFCRMMRGGT